jgi:hypothetical protein
MRAAIWVAVSAALVAADCGGTSSETPWPVEPAGVNLGPAGEAAAARREEPELDGGDERPAPTGKDAGSK